MSGNTVPPHAPTYAQLLRREALSLNLIRLVLAGLVLVSHTWPLGGYGDDATWPFVRPATTLGGLAVGAFFAMSGALVTMSGQRRSIGQFIGSRALRIYPAHLAVLVLSAVFLGPLVFQSTHGSLDGYFTLGIGGPAVYVLHNSTFPLAMQYGIHDVFATTTPFGQLTERSVINGSLWTLPLEVRCYLIALIVVMIGRRFGAARVAAAGLLSSGLLIVWNSFDPVSAQRVASGSIPVVMFELLFVFMCGALAGSVAHRLRINAPIVAAAFMLHLMAWALGGVWYRTIGLGALCILLPALAGLIPKHRLGIFRNDVSYGFYIWSFPVQQTLAFYGWNARPWLFVLMASAATLGLAALSWKLVEEPALRLKDRKPRSPGADAVASAPVRDPVTAGAG